MRNRAEAASFTPLADVRLPEDQELAAASARIANLPMPADVVILGMGDDGHTASWFPGAEGSPKRWTRGSAARRSNVAPHAPEPRLTLTGRVILRARAIALEIQGEAKLATFAAALEPGPEEAMPIRAVLRGAADRLTVFMSSRTEPPPVQRPKSILRLDRRDELEIAPNRTSISKGSPRFKDTSDGACACRCSDFLAKQRIVHRARLDPVDQVDGIDPDVLVPSFQMFNPWYLYAFDWQHSSR